MLYVTILLVVAAALVVLLALMVWLLVAAKRAATAAQVARCALDENIGVLSDRAAALRAELERRRHPRTSGGTEDSTTA